MMDGSRTYLRTFIKGTSCIFILINLLGKALQNTNLKVILLRHTAVKCNQSNWTDNWCNFCRTYKTEFEEQDIWYEHRLIDDMVSMCNSHTAGQSYNNAENQIIGFCQKACVLILFCTKGSHL